MKRVVLAVLGTVAGLVGLLSFKSHGQPVGNVLLPSAAGSGPASSPGPASAGTPSAASAGTGGGQAYLGSAVRTPYGVVQVKATVSASKIVSVSFVQLTALDPMSQQINSAAAPTLLKETLSAQSARVDTVTGATYTSDGYEQSLQAALDKAGRAPRAAGK